MRGVLRWAKNVSVKRADGSFTLLKSTQNAPKIPRTHVFCDFATGVSQFIILIVRVLRLSFSMHKNGIIGGSIRTFRGIKGGSIGVLKSLFCSPVVHLFVHLSRFRGVFCPVLAVPAAAQKARFERHSNRFLRLFRGCFCGFDAMRVFVPPNGRNVVKTAPNGVLACRHVPFGHKKRALPPDLDVFGEAKLYRGSFYGSKF